MEEQKERILVVDDDQVLQRVLMVTLKKAGYQTRAVSSAEEARSILVDGDFHLVLSDVRMPGEDGLSLAKHIAESQPRTAVIMITSDDDPATAEEALDSGVAGYLIKPFQPAQVLVAVSNALRRREIDQRFRSMKETVELTALEDESERPRGTKRSGTTGKLDFAVIGRDPLTRRLLALAENVARTPSTVLLNGESGAGKEVVARYIHSHSPRSKKPFVAVNCAALPPTLLESELFGHEKGSFSGAVQRHQGVFERANSGTLLLDEVSEISPEMQAKLLRVLQERVVFRVGGTQPIKLDVRVVATTNRDLRECVKDGSFRLDLYYRLNVFPLQVPSLRERKRDIPHLTQSFISRLAARMGEKPKPISDGAIDRLKAYSFPGNVRELLNILERAMILAFDDAEIGSQHIILDQPVLAGGVAPTVLTAPLRGAGQDASDDTPTHMSLPISSDAISIEPGEESLDSIEQRVILGTLARYDGNRTRTAKALGVSLRTVRNKIRDYKSKGITVPE